VIKTEGNRADLMAVATRQLHSSWGARGKHLEDQENGDGKISQILGKGGAGKEVIPKGGAHMCKGSKK
jgi:hypothetical protein